MTTNSIIKITAILCLYIISSCTEQQKKIEEAEQIQELKPVINLLYDSIKLNSFKYSDLVKFSTDSIEWEKRKGFYTRLDSLEFFQVYQDTSERYLAQSDRSIDLDFYYSKQKSKRNLIERTFLQQRESEYCDRILYHLYDLNGKLINKFIVASHCGDGGYYENSEGKFINDSTYVLLTEDNYKTEDTVKQNTITYTKTTTIIKRNGEINQNKELINTKIE
ncbi:hypothetical protein [Pedobacter cryophilus]|uniref:Uncharacterized protein n=1 Tax=Pedobacter cryophilus TaxID=2571271 RepID=A0A4U1C6W9_9SPHI|nr:hypothetical protein [Pedobacter cryophilus]TKB99130.1 hypothetical protein FA046_08455 [Pedobacter cryophilus]